MRAAFVTAALCFAAGACGGDDGDPTACDFAVMVENGTAPMYVFEGGVARINVIRDDDPGTVVWGVFANPPGDNISPPVQHGVVPDNASLQVANEITLSVGVAYTVIIAKEDGATCEEPFTP